MIGLIDDQRITVIIGLDDTDHPETGCTTHSFDSLLRTISDSNMFEVSERRLVRLWPFASRRTRGNGALSAIVKAESDSATELEDLCSKWFDELALSISKHPDEGIPASPCLVIAYEHPPESWYWDSVRGQVDLERRKSEASDFGLKIFSLDEGWGIIGATAAISWTPDQGSSWELVAWRDDEKVGTDRDVSQESVIEMTEKHPETFLNRDPTKGKGLIAPRTPCPVLYGIRGSTCEAVSEAHKWMQERGDVESSSSWAPHRTNQLSDDHLTGICSGTVLMPPSEGRGAHTHLSVISAGSTRRLVVFKEGGHVNRLVRQLNPGDRISWLGLESPDGSIHLERVSVQSAVPRISSRPSCCGRTMRSAGRGQPLRCLVCGENSEKFWVSKPWSPSGVSSISGWYEPTPSQRRHLAKPLNQGTPS